MRISDWSSDVCSSDLTDPRPATRLVALAVVNAIIVARAVRAIALVLLAPSAPQLRLPHLSDESAHYCYIWVSRLTELERASCRERVFLYVVITVFAGYLNKKQQTIT